MMFRLLLAAAFLFHAMATNVSADPPAAENPAQSPSMREKIGEALGKPVYRDDIKSKRKQEIEIELHVLFARPAAAKHREKHKAEVEPTEAELAAAQEVLDREFVEQMKDERPKLLKKQSQIEERLKSKDLSEEQREDLEEDREVNDFMLKGPGRRFAKFMLDNWKFQKHLYDTYGGGRVLWQQAGLEAYDANRRWLEDLEAKGEFKITDAALRTIFYEYWNSHDGSPFLTDDADRIREEFLEPTWLRKAKPKPDVKPEKPGT